MAADRILLGRANISCDLQRESVGEPLIISAARSFQRMVLFEMVSSEELRSPPSIPLVTRDLPYATALKGWGNVAFLDPSSPSLILWRQGGLAEPHADTQVANYLSKEPLFPLIPYSLSKEFNVISFFAIFFL